MRQSKAQETDLHTLCVLLAALLDAQGIRNFKLRQAHNHRLMLEVLARQEVQANQKVLLFWELLSKHQNLAH